VCWPNFAVEGVNAIRRKTAISAAPTDHNQVPAGPPSVGQREEGFVARRATSCDSLLVIGHGTRDLAGRAEFCRLAELIAHQRPDLLVQGCYLELAEPSIAAGLRRLAERGARHVRAVPLVLFAAGHAQVDIPHALADAAREWPELRVELGGHLGFHPRILELSARRFNEATGDHSPGAAPDEALARDTLLVLIGRGSSHHDAKPQMQRLADLRVERTPVGHVEIGFVVLAEPLVDAALERAARSDYPRIVVQPHLLFSGLVLETVQAKVRHWASLAPEKRWITTEHLGADEAIAAIVLDNAVQ
jgi:sirohydrochlorin cobaltochelatase